MTKISREWLHIYERKSFQETQMDHVTGTTFSKTLVGLTVGQQLVML